ncbi:MAG: DUF2007 domain-containing protein [Alistipes sp.]|nr:DUF2007 domain-containing protein [Alistipes sp.]
MDTSKIVTLCSFTSLNEAMIYKSLLESNGVACELLNELSVNMLPVQDSLMEVRLVVNAADEALAREILTAQFDQQEFDTESAKRRKKP